jgi:MIP family channel proteins
MAKEVELGRRALIELVGTFMFVFIGAGSAVAAYFVAPTSPPLISVALANGIALGLAVSYAMNISGGHLNPAVTIGMLATKRIKGSDAAAYIAAQVVGAILAGYLLVLLLPHATGAIVNYGTPSLSSIGVLQGIALEAVMTFFLVFTVFGTTVDSRAPKIGGLGVGLVVMVDVLIGGPFTGAAMNPARAIGPAIASLSFSGWYVYWIGPIIGALLAALIYEYCIIGK